MTKADIDDCRPCSDVPEEYPGNRLPSTTRSPFYATEKNAALTAVPPRECNDAHLARRARAAPTDVAGLGIRSDHPGEHLPKALGRVRLGENRDRRAPVLSLEPAGFLAGDKHEAGREVWPAMLDASIKVLANHSGHPKIAQD